MSKTDATFSALVARAHAAGLAAASGTTPDPMVLVDPSVRTVYVVPAGVCGFAGVRIRPGTSAFARWMKKRGLARSSYYGGVETSVREFNQSLTLKTAYAIAYADTLTAAGISATMWERID